MYVANVEPNTVTTHYHGSNGRIRKILTHLMRKGMLAEAFLDLR